MRNLIYIIPLFTLILFSCQNQKQESNTQATKTDSIVNAYTLQSNDVDFGLINETGNNILLFDLGNPITDTSLFTYAFINQTPISIDYIKQQYSDSTASGNQTQNVFDQIGGALFRIEEKLSSQNSDIPYVLIGSTQFKKSREIILTENKLENIMSNTIQETAKNKYKNTIKTSKLIASTPQKDSIFLVELQPLKDSLTVLLIAIEGKNKEVSIQEFKAAYNEMSTWRVDDAGTFPFEDFKILNIFKSNAKLELVTYFPGAEGANLSYLVTDDKQKLNVFKSAYAYWGNY